MTVPPETPPVQNKPSPALLVFLVLPLVMVLAAGVMILSSLTPQTTLPPTPAAVTLPPLPTPVSVADTPIIDFELTTLDGQTVKLSDYLGQMVFLNFWQTTCVPCERELPTFEAFVADQPDDSVVVLAVNVAENAELVRPFLEARNVTHLTVPMDFDSDVASLYGVFNIPITIAINEEGIMRRIKYGEITREDMDAYVAEMIAERNTER